jgi:bacteriorhodopsin
VIFLLGSEGLKSIDPVTTAALYTCFDVFAKVVYGIWSMAGTKAKVTADLAAGEVPEHDLRPAPIAYHHVEAPGRSQRSEPQGRPASARR